jgi:hypothetical protein
MGGQMLEEIYLIYQATRDYLADEEASGACGLEDLIASFRSFCEPRLTR